MLGKSSFPAWHKVYGKTTEKFVPSWVRARMTKNTASVLSSFFSQIIIVLDYFACELIQSFQNLSFLFKILKIKFGLNRRPWAAALKALALVDQF